MRAYRIKKEKIEIEVNGATLLSVDEAEKIPREILNCDECWWLRTPGKYQDEAAVVDYIGSVLPAGSSVYVYTVGVRPVFILEPHNLQIGTTIEIYGIESTIISDKLALVKEPIGFRRFDSETNDYKKSEIKEFVDRWFDELKEGYES